MPTPTHRSSSARSFHLPLEVRWRLADQGTLPTGAFADGGDGAALTLSVRGWASSQQTDTPTARGPEIGEVAADILSACTAMVAAHGGDVIELCGDRVVALWREESQRHAAMRAVSCCLEMQHQLPRWSKRAGQRLRVTGVVCAGEFAVTTLRDRRGKGYFLLTGSGLQGQRAATERARPGDLLLAANASALLEDTVRAAPIAGGMLRVEQLEHGLLPEANHPPAVDESVLTEVMPDIATETSRPARSEQASTVAVRLPAMGCTADLQRMQSVFEESVARLEAHGGDIFDVCVGEEGMTICALFGAEASQKGLSAARAAAAHQSFTPAPRGARSACCSGVTTSTVFATSVSGERRANLVLGDAVPLAKALANRAEGSCICDAQTASAADVWLNWEKVGAARLAGTLSEMQLFRPTGRASLRPAFATDAVSSLQSRWREVLHDTLTSGVGGLLLIETTSSELEKLGALFREDARSLRVEFHAQRATSRSRRVPCATWRAMLGARSTTPQSVEDEAIAMMKRATSVSPCVLLLLAAHWQDAASWSMGLEVISAVPSLLIAALVVSSDTAMTHYQPGQLRETRLQGRLDSLRKRSLIDAMAEQPAQSGDGVDLDQWASTALHWHAWSDVIELCERAMCDDRRTKVGVTHAQRQLRLGDAHAAQDRRADAVSAYELALKALGRSSPRAATRSAGASVLGRITGRFVSPFRDTATDSVEATLTQTLVERLMSL